MWTILFIDKTIFVCLILFYLWNKHCDILVFEIDPIQPYILEQAERHAQTYQSKTAKKINQHRRAIQYRVGDVVYVKTPPPHQKLKPIYQGPGKIIDLANYSAKVQFDDGLIRRVHVSHLK